MDDYIERHFRFLKVYAQVHHLLYLEYDFASTLDCLQLVVDQISSSSNSFSSINVNSTVILTFPNKNPKLESSIQDSEAASLIQRT